MRLIVTGILTDSRGRVLLRQVGAHELSPISRPVEPGRPPAGTLARAFREDTALYVLPVRLTGLYYRNQPPSGELTFVYRCTMRGGELATEDGPRAGFFDELPAGLSAGTRRQIEQALHHPGGPPHMKREGDGLGGKLRRLFGASAEAESEPVWAASAKLIGSLPDGAIAWTRPTPDEPWRLPATAMAGGEAPWEAAARLLADMKLPGPPPALDPAVIQLGDDRSALFVFIAALDNPPPTGSRWLVAADASAAAPLADDIALVEAARQATTRPVF